MSLGNNCKIILTFLVFSLNSIELTLAEDKITTSPLINLNEIKPSFEELENKSENFQKQDKIKIKKKKNNQIQSSHAVLIGLDKITAL